MKAIIRWFDNGASQSPNRSDSRRVDWFRILPFIALHLACLAVFWVGISAIALTTAIILYLLRMFAITAFYHRYFSHKSFKTFRSIQFLFALLGATATQRGPLWWAAHHRKHHRHADQETDPHSPREGFLWSHMGWFLSDKHYKADYSLVKDLSKFPELRLLDRFDILLPVLLAVGFLEHNQPHLGTSGGQMLVWGFFVSTVLLIHATLFINSMAHRFGKQRYNTGDDSRNNMLLALMTLGEGWHNNHHHYPVSVRQGFYWWEIDISYYFLKAMSMLGLIWDLRTVPLARRDSGKINQVQSE